MLKRAALLILVILVAIAVFTFSSRNQGTIDIDLAFVEITASIPVAFTVTLAIGWLFGVLSMGLVVLRLANDRRALRRSLRVSQSEVSTLRSLPLSDAD